MFLELLASNADTGLICGGDVRIIARRTLRFQLFSLYNEDKRSGVNYAKDLAKHLKYKEDNNESITY